MLRRGLKTLDKLDTIEEAERLSAENPLITDRSLPLNYSNPVDLAILKALSFNFDPSDPF